MAKPNLIYLIRGIVGAAIQEVRSGAGILLPFIGAPIIEETAKPIGLFITLLKWPHLLFNSFYTAALAGLTFGAIESTLYVYVYVPDHTREFFLFWFTISLAMHALASFIVGLGIDQRLLAWAQGESPLPRSSMRFFLAGVAIHATYNTVVIALSIAGILDADR